MMTITKHNVIVITISVAIAAAMPLIYLNAKRKRMEYKTFQTSAGWGYDISINKKIFIHQEYVPVVTEKKGFPSEILAIKTAKLIIDKLKNNKAPTLSEAELNHICRE